MRTIFAALVLSGCLADGGRDAALVTVTCSDAADCSGLEFCAREGSSGVCRELPESCGLPADCADPACAEALEELCPLGQRAVRCANPIDDVSEIVGNPSFTCG